jgi:hypothetical protein
MENRFGIPGCFASSKKARTRHQLLATRHSGYATLLQKVRHLASYSRIAN